MNVILEKNSRILTKFSEKKKYCLEKKEYNFRK